MDQPTIKERIQDLFCGITTSEKHLDCIHRKDLRNFARLICEEMTGKPQPLFDEKKYHEENLMISGRNSRIIEEIKKTQEILKALE